MTLYLTTMSFQQSREGTQLDGRVNMEPKGHIDQCDFQRHGIIVTISMVRAQQNQMSWEINRNP